MKPTTTEISNNYKLWCEYVDTIGGTTEEEFSRMTVQEKNLLQKKCFPLECSDIDENGKEITE